MSEGLITFEIDNATWEHLHTLFGNKVSQALNKAGRNIAVQMLQDIKAVIIPGSTPHAPIDRGIYRASWNSRGALDAGLTIYSTAPHAPFIEHGVRAENVKPGKKMIDALTEWVIRKGLVDKKAAKGKARAKSAESAAKMTASLIEKMSAGVSSVKGITHMGITKEQKASAKAAGRAHRTMLQKHLEKTIVNHEARSAAFAIAMHMKKTGIFHGGLHVLEKAVAKIKPQITMQVGRAIAEVFP